MLVWSPHILGVELGSFKSDQRRLASAAALLLAPISRFAVSSTIRTKKGEGCNKRHTQSRDLSGTLAAVETRGDASLMLTA
mmetsp:Transcript_44141/g.65466  ORF Transcript_44141/g.65466 Transcript_44141/m.65466 type:complete len:81 (-) Transcript_44141:140-382(-)